MPPVPVAGAYPLTGVAKLPNATIASPGEVWSNLRANGIIIPGAAVAPVNVGGKLYAKQLVAGDTPVVEQVGVALRQIMTPDLNQGSLYNPALGPNEIVNLAIADGDYLRRYMSGAMHLTLVEPRADYVPGQLIGWAPAAARPAGKAAGTGAWSNAGILAGTTLFEVFEYRPYGSSNEGLLTVRFLRSNQ
jgi:hypothetical protein